MDKKNIERPIKYNAKEYDKEYKKANYKSLSIRIKPDFYTTIDDYCKDNKICKSDLIVNAITEYINNH